MATLSTLLPLFRPSIRSLLVHQLLWFQSPVLWALVQLRGPWCTSWLHSQTITIPQGVLLEVRWFGFVRSIWTSLVSAVGNFAISNFFQLYVYVWWYIQKQILRAATARVPNLERDDPAPTPTTGLPGHSRWRLASKSKDWIFAQLRIEAIQHAYCIVFTILTPVFPATRATAFVPHFKKCSFRAPRASGR